MAPRSSRWGRRWFRAGLVLPLRSVPCGDSPGWTRLQLASHTLLVVLVGLFDHAERA